MDPFFTPYASPLSHTITAIGDKIRDSILRPQKTTVYFRRTVKGTPAVCLPFAVDAWLAAPPQAAPPQPAPIGLDNEALGAAFLLYCALAARAGFDVQGHQFGVFLAAYAALNARRG